MIKKEISVTSLIRKKREAKHCSVCKRILKCSKSNHSGMCSACTQRKPRVKNLIQST